MAGRGPAPKEQHHRERDTKRRITDRQVVITDDGETRGPDPLPEWSEQTVAWYETWRRAPQAQLFEETDWQRLVMLGAIVEAYFRKPNAAALTEIRLSEERMGATVVDRQRARIVIEREAPETTTSADGSVVDARERIAARRRGRA